ncbi:hypothetical protein HJ588_12005 [Flexivirga sp. ID2601S]|uniref:Uncharacterized protein n=1 Tax=Flexivirga aerilata TaxID=1656889 RepID=A0A849AL22_9MICO|nr:hypothetical protein [Flexivirga aerilata]NNG39988.1 hypothetical protein [Flexivirga aerilata]
MKLNRGSFALAAAGTLAVLGLTACGPQGGMTAGGAQHASMTGTSSSSGTSTTAPLPSAKAAAAQAPAAAAKTPEAAPTAPTAPATTSGVTAALRSVSGAQVLSVVRVGSGWEAATQAPKRLTFWTWSAGAWHQDGTAVIPEVFCATSCPAPKLTGALLPGADHATFLVDGGFTGDSTGQAFAFGRGAAGWARWVETDGVMRLVTAPATWSTGLEMSMRFTGGRLVVDSLWGSDNARVAPVLQHRFLRTYRADGSRLRLVADNVFHARTVTPGTVSAPPLPAGAPVDGTWAVRITGAEAGGEQLTVQSPAGGNSLRLGLAEQANITMLATTGAGVTGVTAPSWVFGLIYSGQVAGAADTFTASPYVKPAGVGAFAVDKTAQITVRGGVVTTLVVAGR